MEIQLEESERRPVSLRVEVSDLDPQVHGAVLCYPGTNIESFSDRVQELREIGVQELILEGESKVGPFGVLGKGCVSLVVKAKIDSLSDIVVLKIRRVDANRPSMKADFEMQNYANSFGIGPKAIGSTKNLFAMEFIDAHKIGRWVRGLRARSPKKPARKIVRRTLEQCFELDMHHLDHGELSNPSKHVLIRKQDFEPVIIDYESASRQRRSSNVTAVSQFFFLAGPHSEKVLKVLRSESEVQVDKNALLRILHQYKISPSSSSLAELMRTVHC